MRVVLAMGAAGAVAVAFAVALITLRGKLLLVAVRGQSMEAVGDAMPECVASAFPDLAGRVIPPGFLAVLGDNLASSHDSRHYGLVRASRVHAVVITRGRL